jgi:hypothetical protein
LKLISTCDGQKQSPVNIIKNDTVFDNSLLDISFNNYVDDYMWTMNYNNHTGLNNILPRNFSLFCRTNIILKKISNF